MQLSYRTTLKKIKEFANVKKKCQFANKGFVC